MPQYYSEFEFWSAANQLYWLPLHLVSASHKEADTFAASVRSGLAAHYRIIRETPVSKFVRGLRSNSVAEFSRKKLVGIPNLLDAELWTMTSARSPFRLHFEQLPDSAENLVIDLSSFSLASPSQERGPSPFTVDLPPHEKPKPLTLFNVITPGE